ncbi:phage terminase small subunit P27 family [Mycolicibacter virginiensis]|uniref:Phage terminase small subunit P27 family n=1 Tax=Mycolicibacter virginiensis TaxID=1795032 RepID=A0A9X7NYA3_9MYCO|nr:phage terminase small subunit P27 family [Mycolicibacter virginiensis]PQM51819.1 phage terminase small subunit P27 family [Mycolicibacter virginiensis]
MPAQQPATLLLLNGRKEGQDSAGRPVAKAPLFKRLAPNPPTWLSREAKAEWKRVVPGLTRLDLVKPEDRATLAAYCEVWSRWVAATRDVAANGLVVRNTSVKKDGTESTWFTKNPAVAIAEQAETRLRQYANDFGLTPAGERNVSKRDDDRGEHEANPFAGAVGDD